MSSNSKSAFFKQSSWMVIATFTGGICMALVHTVARKMGSQEYSTFVSLLRLMIIMGVPAAALQTIFARQAAAVTNDQQEEQLHATTRAMLTLTFLVGLVCGGAVLADHFQPNELEALTARIDPSRPTGLDYYPLLRKGERFPIADAERAPKLTPRPADGGIFLQGMLEAMSAIEAEGYAKLAALSGRQLRSLRTVGRGARNPAWTRLRAARIAAPFLPPLSEHAAVGAALLALRASA